MNFFRNKNRQKILFYFLLKRLLYLKLFNQFQGIKNILS